MKHQRSFTFLLILEITVHMGISETMAVEAKVGGDRQPTESFGYGFYFTTSQSSQETGQVGVTQRRRRQHIV